MAPLKLPAPRRWRRPRLRKPQRRPQGQQERKAQRQEVVHKETVAKYSPAVTNVEIFNLSSYSLSPLEKIVLCLGLKFLPVPRFSKPAMLTALQSSISQFHRRLSLALHFAYDPPITDTIPYNPYKPQWSPPNQPWTAPLTCFIAECTKRATEIVSRCRHYYSPSDRLLHSTLINIRNNHDIVIKPADKNLGLVVLNTSDYEAMCLSHLSDKDTYTPVPQYFPNHTFAKLRMILNNHHVLYKDANASPPTLTKLASSLLQLQNNENLRIAPIYCLPKLHKGIHAHTQ